MGMVDMRQQPMYFWDMEVFAHDWLFCVKRQSDGHQIPIWNDCDAVADFIATENPTLCGYNARSYDSEILKAILLGWEPEDVKHVNDTIIESDDRSHVWQLFNGHKWIELPPVIDLFHDLVPRRGLKEIAANIGMSVVESSVPFDIDRPLTPEERAEVERYCLSDIAITEALYDLRFDYLKSKSDLCEAKGVDPLTMLKHTNARVVSEVLQAERIVAHPFETYEVPDNLDTSAIPQDVIEYATKWNTDNCTMKKPETVDFMFHGCPTTFGLGGIHAAVPAYKETSYAKVPSHKETSSDERVILSQDVGSYYPSLIINNGYMSRAVPDASVYEEFYHMRMAAKAAGDKDTAEAAKLVLNTTFGTMKDKYNKMFDPMQATRVCLSGELYILDLIEQMYRAVPEGLQLIQLNTDGWIISIRRDDYDTVMDAVSQWQERTGFTVDTDEIEVIVQANVNNYVLRTVDGKVKAKGGIVGNCDGGDFKSNSMTIIDKAVAAYLLDGTPIETTVNECTDTEPFQIIAKAGRTYKKVVHADGHIDEFTDMPEDVEIQRVNRVYATKLKQYGGIFKIKDENGIERRERVPLTPEHAIVDNDNLLRDIGKLLTMLDKSWYVTLASKKAHEFVTRKKKEKEQMADTVEPTNELTQDTEKPKPTRRNTKKDNAQVPEPTPVPSFGEKLLALQQIMQGASTGVSFDSAVTNLNYEYADTQQYKQFLASAASAVRLVFKLDMTADFLGIINAPKLEVDPKASPSYAAQVNGTVTFYDADDMDKRVIYDICGFGNNVQAGYCLGAAQTNALRNFILNQYLLDNKGREGDDVQVNADHAAQGNRFVSQGEKTQMKQGIVAEKAAEYATDLYAKALGKKIIEARAIKPTFGKKAKLDDHFEDAELTKPKVHPGGHESAGRSTLVKSEAVKAMTKAEEVIAKGAE